VATHRFIAIPRSCLFAFSALLRLACCAHTAAMTAVAGGAAAWYSAMVYLISQRRR